MVKEIKLNNKYYLVGIFALVVTHLVLISRLTFLPYPELFVYPYLTNIGLVPYAQIFDQHFPGLMFFPVNLGTLGIVQPQSALVLHMGIIAFTHILLFYITYKLFKSFKAAFLVSFMFLLWQPFLEGNMLWIDSFLPLLLLPSYYFLAKPKSDYKSILLTGFFLGMALVLKQVILPLIVINFLLFVIKREFKNSLVFIFGAAILPFSMLIYVLSKGVFDDFFYWTITFNLTTFAKMGRKYATLGQLVKIAILYLPAFIILSYYLLKKSRTQILLLLYWSWYWLVEPEAMLVMKLESVVVLARVMLMSLASVVVMARPRWPFANPLTTGAPTTYSRVCRL